MHSSCLTCLDSGVLEARAEVGGGALEVALQVSLRGLAEGGARLCVPATHTRQHPAHPSRLSPLCQNSKFRISGI